MTDNGAKALAEAWKELIAESLRRNVVVAVSIHRPLIEAAIRNTLASQPEAAEEAGLRAQIELDARLNDALDALSVAVLWHHGHMSKPGESWERKVRSGIVGLRAALDPEPKP